MCVFQKLTPTVPTLKKSHPGRNIHRHKVEPMDSLGGTFRISQPGSSVATSLCEGEAVSKKVGLLEIRGNDFRLHGLPLSQVSVIGASPCRRGFLVCIPLAGTRYGFVAEELGGQSGL